MRNQLTASTFDAHAWVSPEEIEAARAAARAGEKHSCSLCVGYGAPGFIFNADQWVNCFQCNYGYTGKSVEQLKAIGHR